MPASSKLTGKTCTIANITGTIMLSLALGGPAKLSLFLHDAQYYPIHGVHYPN